MARGQGGKTARRQDGKMARWQDGKTAIGLSIEVAYQSSIINHQSRGNHQSSLPPCRLALLPLGRFPIFLIKKGSEYYELQSL
jgi:hypothetical protein